MRRIFGFLNVDFGSTSYRTNPCICAWHFGHCGISVISTPAILQARKEASRWCSPRPLPTILNQDFLRPSRSFQQLDGTSRDIRWRWLYTFPYLCSLFSLISLPEQCQPLTIHRLLAACVNQSCSVSGDKFVSRIACQCSCCQSE